MIAMTTNNSIRVNPGNLTDCEAGSVTSIPRIDHQPFLSGAFDRFRYTLGCQVPEDADGRPKGSLAPSGCSPSVSTSRTSYPRPSQRKEPGPGLFDPGLDDFSAFTPTAAAGSQRFASGF